ncbi:MAG: hypothetical protein RBS38_06975 [Bacteroidales bacterium]|jgi:hypothetical protein|nr:hypothetical protein [Bacteroidales bacterium]
MYLTADETAVIGIKPLRGLLSGILLREALKSITPVPSVVNEGIRRKAWRTSNPITPVPSVVNEGIRRKDRRALNPITPVPSGVIGTMY